MRLPDPAGITTRTALRQFAVRLLTAWCAGLDRGKIPFHVPRRLGLMRLQPRMPFHLHPELFLQVSGSTTFHFPEETCRVGPGEICLVSRGLPHLEKVRPWRGPFYNVVIGCLPDRFTLHLAHRTPDGWPDIVALIESPILDGAYLADLMKTAADWSDAGDAAHRLAVKGLMLANLSYILATIRAEPADAPEPLKVTQVRQLILRHLAEPQLSVEWIGRTLQSSPEYLSALFRKSVGTAPLAYITERRMHRARDLLVTSTLNIAEVSRACGYEDPSYFTRVFRREAGLAPRQFRNHARQHAPA